MRYATSKGTEGGSERTEYGELLEDLRTACRIRDAGSVRQAREALDRYHAARGGRPTSTRTAPTVRTSTTPARGGSGSMIADLARLDTALECLDRMAAGDARRRSGGASSPAYTSDGGRIEYDDDAEDDTDLEVVVSEAEQRRQLRELCRV